MPWNFSNFNFLGFPTIPMVNPSTERFPAMSDTRSLISFTFLKLQKTWSDLLSNTLFSAPQLLLYSVHNSSSRITHNVSFQPLNLNVATYSYLRLMSSFCQWLDHSDQWIHDLQHCQVYFFLQHQSTTLRQTVECRQHLKICSL